MTDETTTGAAPAAAAVSQDVAGITLTMPTTPAPIKGFFENLINELEAIPGEVTYELSVAKEKVMAAISYVESHFQSAKTTAETDVASIKTDATDVQAAVEKAV
jgi:hypothetical protein